MQVREAHGHVARLALLSPASACATGSVRPAVACRPPTSGHRALWCAARRLPATARFPQVPPLSYSAS